MSVEIERSGVILTDQIDDDRTPMQRNYAEDEAVKQRQMAADEYTSCHICRKPISVLETCWVSRGRAYCATVTCHPKWKDTPKG